MESPSPCQWRPRPALRRTVRVAALSAPVVAAVAAGVAMGRALPMATGLGATMWWIAVVGVATIALVTVDRLARHALPLAWLYGLRLTFAEPAPSRLRVALRSAFVGRRRRDPSRIDRLVALSHALSTHDRRTRAHSERVRALTRLVGEQLRLAGPAVERLEWAAFFHDIGKLSVPPAILNKTGRPDDDEWSVLVRHPDEGAHLAEPLTPWLGDWLRGVRDHHEHWDGTGYPVGLSGADISLAGRIVSVTDAFETMTAVHSYKRPKSATSARRELVACSGTQFDPHIVRAFLDVSRPRLWWILGPAAWLALVPLVGRIPRLAAGSADRQSLAGGLRAVAVALAVTGAAASLALAHPRVDQTAVPHPRQAAVTSPAPSPAPASPTTMSTRS